MSKKEKSEDALLEKSKKLIDEADDKDEIEILKSEIENLKKEKKQLEEVVEQTRSVNEKLFLKLSNEVKVEQKKEEDEEIDEDLKTALENIEKANAKFNETKKGD